MYHVQHIVEGTDHVFVFKPVTMPAEYREYSMVEGREIVRLKCHVEAVAKSVNNTKVTLGQNASGERTIEEIALFHAYKSRQTKQRHGLALPFSGFSSITSPVVHIHRE